MTNQTAVSQEKIPTEKVFLNTRSRVKCQVIPSEKSRDPSENIIQLCYKQTHLKHILHQVDAAWRSENPKLCYH